MINKAFKEYTENVYNQDLNYETILLKEKKEADIRKIKKKRILNIAAMFIAVILVGALSTQIYAKIHWDIEFKQYQNREYATGTGAIKEAVASGYNEIIGMDYIKQDGISVKIDSLMLSDDHFEANVHFIFDEGIELNSETFTFGFAVYDDKNNVYGISERIYYNAKGYGKYTKYILEDIGVDYNKKDLMEIQYYDSSSNGNIYAKEREIVSKISIGSTRGFPRSKKIYIRIFDLGYNMMDISKENVTAEDFDISDAEWIFEIEVPEKFYDRQTIQLTLKDEIPEINIQKMTLTETGMVIKFKSKEFRDVVMSGRNIPTQEWNKIQKELICITDGEGKSYTITSMGTTGEEHGMKVTCDINKSALEKHLFINIKLNGKEYRSELIEKQ